MRERPSSEHCRCASASDWELVLQAVSDTHTCPRRRPAPEARSSHEALAVQRNSVLAAQPAQQSASRAKRRARGLVLAQHDHTALQIGTIEQP